MIKRDYQAPQFQGVQQVSPTQQAVQSGNYAPVQDVRLGETDWKDSFVARMGGKAAQMLERAAEGKLQSLYLEGAAQAGIIESEEELQGNPLTRDWKVAGYRDTMGKMQMADAEASFAADIKTLREQGPEELAAYLKKRRNKILPELEGMSADGRKATVGQMYLLDKAATKTHTMEHAKFIIESKSQAVHTGWNTTNQLLTQAQIQTETGEMTPEVFQDHIRTAVGNMTTGVWFDNSLPTEVKKQLTFEMLQVSMAQDNVALYEYLQDNPIMDGSGKPSNVIGRLTGEQQLKLSGNFREAMQRTSDVRGLARMEQLAQTQAQIDAGTYAGSYDDLNGTLSRMVMNKTISSDTYRATLNNFLDKQLKGEQQSALASMAMRGDVIGIANAGATQEKAIDAIGAVLAKTKASPEKHLNTWLNVGVNGMDQGFKQAGVFLGATMRQIAMSKGEVLPQHKQMFETVNAAIGKANEMGLTNTRSRILSGLPEEDRAFAEQVFTRIDGVGLDAAVEQAKDLQAKDALMTPAARAALSQATTTQLAKEINALGPRGVMSTGWGMVKSIVSGDAAADLSLRPKSFVGDRDGWLSDSPTVQAYTERVRTELMAEATTVAGTRPSASASEVLSIAKANVAARTIDTIHGPVVMPKDVDLQQVYGVAPGNQAAMGEAINGLLPSTVEDSRWFVTFQQGRMFAQEFDNKGSMVGSGKFFEASQIKAKIADDTLKVNRTANAIFGPGHEVKADGLQFKYNGDNTAGVAGQWMYGFRENLVANEGVKSSVYKDTVGVNTVGVGVSEKNDFYPKADKGGKITSEQAQKSFIDASNAAANTGAKLARSIGKNNQFAFQLFSELAYHSGAGFATRKDSVGDEYRTVIRLMQEGTHKEATDAFRSTAAYRVGGAKRGAHYLRLIENSMK